MYIQLLNNIERTIFICLHTGSTSGKRWERQRTKQLIDVTCCHEVSLCDEETL